MPLRMPLNLAKLRTLRQFADENPAFTNDYLHYLISRSAQNGIEACLVRIGAKLFLDVEAFTVWIQEQPHNHDRGGHLGWKKRQAKAARAGGVEP